MKTKEFLPFDIFDKIIFLVATLSIPGTLIMYTVCVRNIMQLEIVFTTLIATAGVTCIVSCANVALRKIHSALKIMYAFGTVYVGVMIDLYLYPPTKSPVYDLRHWIIVTTALCLTMAFILKFFRGISAAQHSP